MKNTNGGVLLLAKLQAKPANLVKMRFLHGCFSRFLNCTNGTKSCNASCILKIKSEVGSFLHDVVLCFHCKEIIMDNYLLCCQYMADLRKMF